MTLEEFEALKDANQHTNEFGAITEIDHWPIVTLTYSLDGLPPLIHGRKERLTIVSPEGEPPQLAGIVPLGEVTLTSEMVAAIPGWSEVEDSIKEALETEFARQEARRNPPPPIE